MAKGIHLFPYRTQKLSLSAPMVLGWRRLGRVGRCRIPQRKSLRRCLGLFLCASRQFFLPGRLQANVQHCTWLGSPVCAACGGFSTWGNTWESRTLPDSAWGYAWESRRKSAEEALCIRYVISPVVFNECATMKDNCFTKRNSIDIIPIGSFASEVEIVLLHTLWVKRDAGRWHTRLMQRYRDGRKSVPFPLYQVF